MFMTNFFSFTAIALPWGLLFLSFVSLVDNYKTLNKQKTQEAELTDQIDELTKKLQELSDPRQTPSATQTELSETIAPVTNLDSVGAILDPLGAKETDLSTFLPTPKTSSSISPTAKQLINLRDWVLLAKSDCEVIKPELMDSVYKKLAKILELEGVIALEDTGLFDMDKHEIVGTEPTENPKENDLIHSTIRPGYLFKDKLIRPQEVIIYST